MKRQDAMSLFMMNEKGILITTNLCSRAIDLNCNISINFDVPEFDNVIDTKVYMQRSSRVGRFGKNGVVLTFVSEKFMDLIRLVESQYKIKINKL